MTSYEPPPEAALIKSRREALIPKPSIRAIAKSIGLSEGRWRQIESGYQTPSAGVQTPVIAPAETLARMALAVGITPDELREVGRQDAADIQRMLGRSVPKPTVSSEVEPTSPEDPVETHELVLEDNWNAVVQLTEEVLRSDPSMALREKTQRIVFLMSGYLIMRILDSGTAAQLEGWLARIYVEREDLYRKLAVGEPQFPWVVNPHESHEEAAASVTREWTGRGVRTDMRFIVQLIDGDGPGRVSVLTHDGLDELRAAKDGEYRVLCEVGPEIDDEAALSVGRSLLKAEEQEQPPFLSDDDHQSGYDLARRTAPTKYTPGQSHQGDAGGDENQDEVDASPQAVARKLDEKVLELLAGLSDIDPSVDLREQYMKTRRTLDPIIDTPEGQLAHLELARQVIEDAGLKFEASEIAQNFGKFDDA